MNALVVLENHFFLDENNNVWCDRVVDYNYLKRYLNVFDEITLVGRTSKVKKIEENKLLVSGKNVNFVSLPDFKGAVGLIKNYFKINKIIKQQMILCDCAIYRAPTHLSLFTYKEVLKINKPLILEFMMAADKMFEGNNFVTKMLNNYVNKKTKKMCLQANGVSYVTEHILQEEYPCKAMTAPENQNFFTGNYSSIDIDEKMFYKQKWKNDKKPKTFKIIHTGYMDSYRKGQAVLIKAVKKVCDKGYSVKLTLIGDGKRRKVFERLAIDLGIGDKVEFVGLIKEKIKLLKYLRKSHFLVFPTQSEGLPRTIIEGMSQGLVCISSPVDGIPELLKQEYLVDCNDVDGYANKIIEMINDWDRMIINSNENYNNTFKYEQKLLAKKRSDFYKKVYDISFKKSKNLAVKK